MGEFREKGVDAIVHRLVKNPLPTERYKSTVGVYGGEIRYDQDGKMVYDTRILRPGIIKGIASGIDVAGDRILRTYDDHVVQNPKNMLLKHPRKFLEFTFGSRAPRHRGSTKQILENVKRLGLIEYYGEHPWGIEIKKPEIFKKGIALQDVLRAKEIGDPVLIDIDPLQALREATIYIKKIHDEYGPIGDLIADIMFTRKEGGEVKYPVLNIPDVVFTPSTRRIRAIKKALGQKTEEEINLRVKKVLAAEQKATDVLEYLVHTAFEVIGQSGDSNYTRRALDVIIEAYADKHILSLVKSFLKRGRPTLPGMEKPKGPLKYFFLLHNKVHLSANAQHAHEVRQLAIEELTKFTLQ